MRTNAPSRIALVRCDSYEPAVVKNSVRRAVELLGGIDRFIRPEQHVLIKPNMLSPQPPERQVTTHPSVVEAVIELVKSAGALPSVGDSPGFYKFSRVAEVSGIGRAAEKAGARLVPFANEEEIITPECCLMKRLIVDREVVRADAVISVPKFKTHCLTHITGAIKNLFGCIPGLKKAEMHLRFPDNERFSRMLVDMGHSIPVGLHIVDAVTVMDGNGPSAGDPFLMNLIIAGIDPVAVDSTACRVAGIDPSSVPMIRLGEECGLGVAEAEHIEIVGEHLQSVRVTGFRSIAPRAGFLPLPPSISNRIQRWIVRRPRILGRVCTRCGACIQVCPARPKALGMERGQVVIDDDACILCYCCNEICPSRAVRLRRGFAAGILARLLGI